MERQEIFIQKLCDLKIKLSDQQLCQFMTYYNMLIEWNKVMNLTAITEYEEVITKHFIDSLTLIKSYDLLKYNNISVIDIGTGAGFPGIPLKIVFPELKVLLLDSLNKRIKFLNAVIDQLKLKDITTLHGRAEDYGQEKKYREQFDLAVSRAVSNLTTLTEYCLPFVKVGGTFVSYKSGNTEQEVKECQNAATILGGSITGINKFQLPGTSMERSLIVIDKNNKTPKLYPRSAGKPSRDPIR